MTTAADLQAEFEAMLEDDFFGEDIVYIQTVQSMKYGLLFIVTE